ncbi:TMEM165/GDT1 family protein [Nocardia higoensis]|uniref:TMEM165/GDT1 family protein n=1 Tax=Nocardia higoensis TaxID=228599 RepID=UPI0002E9F5B3|nr:TMEM165/GDT1 family protein [Nocardia higoensis]
MTATIALSIGIVFLAELGDKSQLMALTFALRYRWWVVLSAIAAATAGVHVLSVAVGYFLGASLPTTAIAFVAALTFLGVGLWTLREHLGADDDEEPSAPSSRTAPFLVVLSAVLLAELGDRTMFATAALATDNNWFGVWIGSTIGMVAADGLAIAVGILVGKHLPERLIGLASGVLFLIIGTATLLSALGAAPLVAVGVVAAVLALTAAVSAGSLLRRRRVLAAEASADEALAAEAPTAEV